MIVDNIEKSLTSCGISYDKMRILQYVKDYSVYEFLQVAALECKLSLKDLLQTYKTISDSDNKSVSLISHARETLYLLKEKGIEHYFYTPKGE